MLKKILKHILSKPTIEKVVEFKFEHFDRYALKSYSQEGEDMILRRLFENQPSGFYVDVGAHHPKKFSNTYYFYKKGWRGINIDAMPGSMKLFSSVRPRDINIEKAISDKKQVLTYHAFNESALNGFSKKLSDQREKNGNYSIQFTKDIETTTLENILNENLPKSQKIDFLSIDVEGLDFMVIKSNNFDKYKPRVILVEILGSRLCDIENDEISNYLKQYSYSVYAKSVTTIIFISDHF